jgi:uncharacterized membrane protein
MSQPGLRGRGRGESHRTRPPINLWHHHPGVRTGDKLTSGERAADLVRNGMGSWPFVFAFLGSMAVWAAVNGNHGVDPYPFILLNLFLSMIAGLQGAILLISAKRADSISSEVALHTLGNTKRLQELIEANTVLTTTVSELATQIHAHVCGSESAAKPQVYPAARRR